MQGPQTIDYEPDADTDRQLATITAAPQDSLSRVEHFLSLAIERGADPDSLTKLLDLQERMMALQAKAAATHSLQQMQSEIPPVPKTRSVNDKDGNPLYQFAALEDVKKHLQPFLDKHGFTLTFNSDLITEAVDLGGGKSTVRQSQLAECIVTHHSGHSWTAHHKCPVDVNMRSQNVSQQGASAETYAKRRALMNAFGLVASEEDDDARGANRPPANEPPPANPNAPRAQPRGGRVQGDEIAALVERWKRLFGGEDAKPQDFGKWAFATAAVPVDGALKPSAWSREAMKTCNSRLDMDEQEAFGG